MFRWPIQRSNGGVSGTSIGFLDGDRVPRCVRDLPCGDARIVLELDGRRVRCKSYGHVKSERLDFLADNPLYTKRFACYVGCRCRQAAIKDVAEEFRLHWETIKTLEMQYMRAQLVKAGTPGPKAIGVDEISIRKGHHTYRIVVSDLIRGRRSGSEVRTAKRRAWDCATTGWEPIRRGVFAWR